MPLEGALGPSDFYNQAYNQAQGSRELDMRMQEMRQQQMYQNLMLQQQMRNTQANVDHTNAETNMMLGGGPGAMQFRRNALMIGVDPSALPPIPGYGNAQGGAPSNQSVPGLNGPVSGSYSQGGSSADADMAAIAAAHPNGGAGVAGSGQGGFDPSMLPQMPSGASGSYQGVPGLNGPATAYMPQTRRQNAGGQRPATMPSYQGSAAMPQGVSPMVSSGTGLPSPDSVIPPDGSARSAPDYMSSSDPETASALAVPPSLAAAMPQGGALPGAPGASLMPPEISGSLPPRGAAPSLSSAPAPASTGPSFGGVQYDPNDTSIHPAYDPTGKHLTGLFSFLSPSEVEFRDPMGNLTHRQTTQKMDQGYDTPAAAVDYERQNGLSGGTVEKNQFGKYDIKGAAPMPPGATMNKDQSENMLKLKDHYDMLPQIREASDAVGSYNRFNTAIAQGTGAGDKIALEALQGLVNPRQAVSIAAQKGAPVGVVDYFRNLPDRIASGASIPSDVRPYLRQIADDSMAAGKTAIQNQIGSHLYLANAMGIPQDVASKSFVNPYDSISQSGATKSAPSGSVLMKDKDGNQFYIPQQNAAEAVKRGAVMAQ